jgi:uncharacterized protein YaiE (UPF0345 family)
MPFFKFLADISFEANHINEAIQKLGSHLNAMTQSATDTATSTAQAVTTEATLVAGTAEASAVGVINGALLLKETTEDAVKQAGSLGTNPAGTPIAPTAPRQP